MKRKKHRPVQYCTNSACIPYLYIPFISLVLDRVFCRLFLSTLSHTHILIDRILPMQSRSRLQSKRYPHAGRRCSDLQKAALTILGGDEGPIQREVVSLCPSLCDIDISLLH
jgi:hypothetical protein